MPIDPQSLTREQIRDLIQRQRAGYEQMERDRLRQEWREPTIEEKDAFDRMLSDLWEMHRGKHGSRDDSELASESETSVFHRTLLKIAHE